MIKKSEKERVFLLRNQSVTKITILGLNHVCQTNVVFVIYLDHIDLCILY